MPNLLSRWFSRRRRRSAADEVAAQSVLGYHFRDPDLRQEALTHRSYANSVEPSSTYERLEFLGDSVLGLVVARYLYLKHAELDEGELTKLKASLVNLKTLTAVARREGLGDVIRISVEEDKAGGRLRGSILSDVLESIIGAVYLDGGLDAASALVERVVIRPLVEQTPDLMEVNYKGELLEHLQGQGLGMPRYEVTDERGPDHQKIFTVVVYAQGRVAGEGTGANKKDAEQQAARAALNTLGIMPEREVAP